MYAHDLIALKFSETIPVSEGAWSLRTDTPAVMLVFPQSEVMQAETAEDVRLDMPYANLAFRISREHTGQDQRGKFALMVTQVISGEALTSQQKAEILDEYRGMMGEQMYGYLWCQGQQQADYAFNYPQFPYPMKAVPPKLLRSGFSRLLSAAGKPSIGVDRSGMNIGAAAQGKDVLGSISPMLLELAGIVPPNRIHLPSVMQFSEHGWFGPASDTDVSRRMVKPGDRIRLNSGRNGVLHINLSEYSGPVKLSGISSLDIGGKVQDNVMSIVLIPLPKGEQSLHCSEDDMQVETISGVEILAPGVVKRGTPYQMEITDADCEAVVQNFNALAEQIKPPLRQWKPKVKLGHNPTITGETDGLPSLGWVTNVRKDSGRVVCDLTSVPKRLADLVKVSAYRRVSPELKIVKRSDGTRDVLLTALSLLGADIPEIKSLKDIHALYRPVEQKIACSEDAEIVDVCLGEIDVQLALDTKGWEFYDAVTAFLQGLMQTNFDRNLQRVERHHVAARLLEELKQAIGVTADSIIHCFTEESMKGDHDMKAIFEYLKERHAANPEVRDLAFSEENLKKVKAVDQAEHTKTVEAAKVPQVKLSEAENARQDQEITAEFQRLMKAGKVLPAQEKEFKLLAKASMANTVNLSEGQPPVSVFKVLITMLDANAVHAAMSEGLPADPPPANPTALNYERGKAAAEDLNKRKQR